MQKYDDGDNKKSTEQLNEKYGNHLQKIIIINPTWHIHSILAIISPFLNKEIQSLIEILS